MSSLAKLSFEEGPYAESFRLLADHLVKLGEQIGVRIIGYRNPSLPLFRSLPSSAQAKIIEELKCYLQVCELTASAGHKLNDSRQLLWYGLRSLGYVPPSDLFDKITDQMVVEIHDPELHQVFRNFVFYQYCSYSLEELHCQPWTDLYLRDVRSIEAMMKVVNKIFVEGEPFVDCRGIKHYIVETQSVFKLKMNYELIYSWGLKRKSGKVEAWLIAEAAELIDPPSALEEERLLSPHLKLIPLELI